MEPSPGNLEDNADQTRSSPIAAGRNARVILTGVVVVVAVVVGVLWFGPGRSGGEIWPGFRAHARSTGGGMTAIVSGVLEMDAATGCIWLVGESGSRSPVVWPRGTRMRAEPPAVIVPGGLRAASGHVLTGEGGYVQEDQVAETFGFLPFPDECVASHGAAVFNSGSRIEVAAR